MVKNNETKYYAKQNVLADAIHDSIIEYLKTKDHFYSR